jgi:large subunit ribosomal protein L13
LNLYRDMKYTIDATEKKLGRVATEAAVLLMGKNTTTFARNIVPKVQVHITNASKAAITPKKLTEKEYLRYSGYPGGLKSRTMAQVVEKKGYGEVFRKAVYGMLPGNKLRSIMMKNLVVEE